ncbi:MAG: hypothetical protein RID18_15450 [Cytophagales bacterium]
MERKVIVYVPRRSRIRLYKIAKSVSYSAHFKLILVCEETFYDKNLFEGLFDEVIFYEKHHFLRDNKFYKFLSRKLVFSSGLKRLVRILDQIKPELIHSFCEPYDHIQQILKNTKYPVIMTDGADFTGISGGLENIDSRTKKMEKYCFENVQGLVYKGPRLVTDYYRSKGYKIECPELTWFDHCDEELFVKYPNKKLSAIDGEIHMVYTGNISTNPKIKYCYYPPLAKIMAKQKIHFHIYANPYQFKTSKEYADLDKNEKYFHFHEPLPLKKLISEISKYDWGLWIHAEDPSFRTQEAKMRTGIGNKLFTYLEAGLPIIVSDSRKYGEEVVRENNLGFSLNDNEWTEIRRMTEEIDYFSLQKNILQKRSELSLRNNSESIVNFYLKVIKK